MYNIQIKKNWKNRDKVFLWYFPFEKERKWTNIRGKEYFIDEEIEREKDLIYEKFINISGKKEEKIRIL